MIRVAADAMAKPAPTADGERGVLINTASVAAYRRPDRPGGLCGVQGRRGRHDAADRARPGAQRHPLRDDRARHLRDADAARHAAGGAGRARQDSPVSLAARQSGRVRARSRKHIVENTMLNGETIRLDGAIRMPPK